ncbi:DinB superfamily protein [Pedococcus dokdonensis]|uniref:DinB superfamily protein n=1 Tax=Pedococcus dokdonensis TaxID=443156 RepID=A0A1H0U347_9MICO|nr:DinB family protein [Pedococcus dokdonensis]SDP60594.1 DinB superfamily protein [Pedococcus dokdonensis]
MSDSEGQQVDSHPGFDATHRGVTFRRHDLTGAVFDDTWLTGARFRNVAMKGARITGSQVVDVVITGDVEGLVVNGVDVTEFVEAELTRREPDRVKMRPRTPAQFRAAWDILERRWAETFERAGRLDPELLHTRVDDEWSFIETQRHLVFATDSWIRRALLGDPSPWSPLDLPHDDMGDIPAVPRDPDARPSLDEVLALRRDRMTTMREVVDGLTDEQLAGRTTPVTEPGYPESRDFLVADVVGCIINEEWQHHQYAIRDLAVLESGREA